MNNTDLARVEALLADADDWGPTGTAGRDESQLRAATSEERADVSEALGLQMISIRLQKQLLHDLKLIAEHHGIGYQPMIRDLLTRFARSEIVAIFQHRVREIEAAEHAPSTAPVEDFLQRRTTG